jgi:hypothetical protein
MDGYIRELDYFLTRTGDYTPSDWALLQIKIPVEIQSGWYEVLANYVLAHTLGDKFEHDSGDEQETPRKRKRNRTIIEQYIPITRRITQWEEYWWEVRDKKQDSRIKEGRGLIHLRLSHAQIGWTWCMPGKWIARTKTITTSPNPWAIWTESTRGWWAPRKEGPEIGRDTRRIIFTE